MEEISAWMNSVDENVKVLLQDLTTAEEFENQKATFQVILQILFRYVCYTTFTL